MNTQEKNVSKYLKSINVSFNAALVIENHTRDENWKCDQWTITFKGKSAASIFEFFTGIGHRKIVNHKDFKAGTMIRAKTKTIKPYTSHVQFEVVSKPTPASVLYCLIGDMEATNETFGDWCDNYGYDNDSMKAHAIYNACIENAKKLQTIFKTSHIDKLRELLEDY